MINTVVFKSPDMFTEFGGVSEFSVAKRSGVVSVSCFKGVFCESDVGVFLVVVFAGYCGLVNNARL